MRYVLTYRFRDGNDRTSRQRRIRIEISLTPFGGTGRIRLKTFVMGTDLQWTHDTTRGFLRFSRSSRDQWRNVPYPIRSCSSRPVAARRFGALCRNTFNYIQHNEPLTVERFRPGGWTEFCARSCSRAMTYLHPGGFTQPARDAVVWDTRNRALANETQFFNLSDPIQTWRSGNTFQGALDQQLTIRDAAGARETMWRGRDGRNR
jgi:hypothetical protein